MAIPSFCSPFEYFLMTYLLFLVFGWGASHRSLLPLPLVVMFDPFVAIEGARLRERLRADVALVWLGLAVNPQVYDEVQFLDRCHAAARVLAVIVRRVSFGPVVQDPVDWVHILLIKLFVIVFRLWFVCWPLLVHSGDKSLCFLLFYFLINLIAARALIEARFRIGGAFRQLTLKLVLCFKCQPEVFICLRRQYKISRRSFGGEAFISGRKFVASARIVIWACSSVDAKFRPCRHHRILFGSGSKRTEFFLYATFFSFHTNWVPLCATSDACQGICSGLAIHGLTRNHGIAAFVSSLNLIDTLIRGFFDGTNLLRDKGAIHLILVGYLAGYWLYFDFCCLASARFFGPTRHLFEVRLFLQVESLCL